MKTYTLARFGVAVIGLASHARAADRPNVLLFFSDQHQAACLGVEGHPDVMTPNLDKLAGESVRFTRAYSNDAICAPSRMSMMSGGTYKEAILAVNLTPAAATSNGSMTRALAGNSPGTGPLD